MGAKTMRRKKFRLAITILLCFLSFAAFGVADVMLGFDVNQAVETNLYESDDNYISISAFLGDEKLFADDQGIECSEEDLQKLRQLTGLDFHGVIGRSYAPSVWDSNLLDLDNDIDYYSAGSHWTVGSLPASQELFDALGFKLYGRLPSNENEIVITRRRYDQYKIAGIDLGCEYIYPEEIGDFQDFLDNIVPRINASYEYSIVGVVDTFADADGRILNIKPNGDNYLLNWTINKYFELGYHNLSYIHQSLYDKYIDDNRMEEDTTGFGRATSIRISGTSTTLSANGTASEASLKYVDNVIWLDGKGDRKELAENEIVIGCSSAAFLWQERAYSYESRVSCNYSRNFFNGKVSFYNMSLYNLRHNSQVIAYCIEAEEISLQELEIYKEYCRNNLKFAYSGLWDLQDDEYSCYINNFDIDTMTEDEWRFSYACYLSVSSYPINEVMVFGGYYNNVTGRKSGEQLKKENAVKIFVENRIEKSLSSATWTAASDFTINFSGFTQQRNDHAVTYDYDSSPVVVGIYFAKEGYPNDYMINDKAYYKSLDYEYAMYNFLIASFSGDTKTKDAVNTITQLHYDTSEFRNFYCNNPIVNELQTIAVSYRGINKMLYWGSAIVGLFSILLLGNYIELSISSKKKEIGILRAVGAKKSDIFAIFINEGAIITAIIVALAVIGAGLLTLGLNALAPSLFGLTYNIKVLSFGIRQVALLLAVCFGTTAIASAIPLIKLSRKKPVDSIQDR